MSKRSSGRSRSRRSGRSPFNINPANRGKLRRAAKAKKGRKISVKKLRQLKRSKNPTTRKRATFALNARSFNKGGRKRKR